MARQHGSAKPDGQGPSADLPPQTPAPWARQIPAAADRFPGEHRSCPAFSSTGIQRQRTTDPLRPLPGVPLAGLLRGPGSPRLPGQAGPASLPGPPGQGASDRGPQPLGHSSNPYPAEHAEGDGASSPASGRPAGGSGSGNREAASSPAPEDHLCQPGGGGETGSRPGLSADSQCAPGRAIRSRRALPPPDHLHRQIRTGGAGRHQRPALRPGIGPAGLRHPGAGLPGVRGLPDRSLRHGLRQRHHERHSQPPPGHRSAAIAAGSRRRKDRRHRPLPGRSQRPLPVGLRAARCGRWPPVAASMPSATTTAET